MVRGRNDSVSVSVSVSGTTEQPDARLASATMAAQPWIGSLSVTRCLRPDRVDYMNVSVVNVSVVNVSEVLEY